MTTLPQRAVNPTVSFRVQHCARLMAAGGVIACPTEAVWGLSCDPWNDRAIERLLALKSRPAHKGLILVAADESQLAFLLDELPDGLRRKLRLSWPGPNTWLVPHHHRVSPLVHGRFSKVAVRVSGHPLVRSLCRAFGGPLVSTSANPAGVAAPTSVGAVRRYFGAQLDGVLPGPLGGADRPSTIRDVFDDKVLRS